MTGLRRQGEAQRVDAGAQPAARATRSRITCSAQRTGMTTESARAAYVQLVVALDPCWMPAAVPAVSEPERKQTWVVFSSMQDTGCIIIHHPLVVHFSRHCPVQRLLRQQRRLLQAAPPRLVTASPISPPACSAAVAGHTDTIRCMLAARSHVDTRDENDQTMSAPPIPSMLLPTSSHSAGCT